MARKIQIKETYENDILGKIYYVIGLLLTGNPHFDVPEGEPEDY